jgi:Eco57I restriction endonuclease.
MKKFYGVIGNPPYQEQVQGDNKNSAAPIYPDFLEEAFEVGEVVELIHPARFLFNAGSTPKAWNKKMLQDTHFKVLHYEPDSSKMFTNTDIKGGVAITLRNPEKDFGEIGVFTAFDELNSLLSKVIGSSEHESFAEIVVTRTAYRLTDKMHKDYPLAIDSLSDGHPYDMSTNIFELLPNIFFDSKPSSSGDYIQILGRENNRRAFKYIRAEYVNEPKNLDCWKVILPQIG